LRTVNGREHRRKNFVTVLQGGHAVAGNDGGPEQLTHAPQKLRVLDGEPMRELVANLFFAAARDGNARRQQAGDREDAKRGDAASKRNAPPGFSRRREREGCPFIHSSGWQE
jgi:hypothetical protein